MAKAYNGAHKLAIFGILSFTTFLGAIFANSAYNRIKNGQRMRAEALEKAKARKEGSQTTENDTIKNE